MKLTLKYLLGLNDIYGISLLGLQFIQIVIYFKYILRIFFFIFEMIARLPSICVTSINLPTLFNQYSISYRAVNKVESRRKSIVAHMASYALSTDGLKTWELEYTAGDKQLKGYGMSEISFQSFI